MNPARSSWAPPSGRGNLADVSTSTAAVADPAETPEHAAVRAAAQRAAAAAPGVRSAGGPAVDAALRTMAAALRDRTADLLAANTADVEAAERGGMTGGLLDRLRLTPERLADMAVQLEVLADTPEPPLQRFVRDAAHRRAGVRAAGTGRGDRRRVRGPAERDDRRRLAGAQGPQRRGAADRRRRPRQRDGPGRAGDRAVAAGARVPRPRPCSSSRPPATPAPTRSSACPISSRSSSSAAAARSPGGSPRSAPPRAPACSPTPTAAACSTSTPARPTAAVAHDLVHDSTGPARRLQPAQPAADRPRARYDRLWPVAERASIERGIDPEPAAARAPRSATSGRSTRATRRT